MKEQEATQDIQGTSKSLTADFPSEGSGATQTNSRKEECVNQEFYIQKRASFENYRENKRFPGKQKLKGLAGITLALQKIL